MNILLLGSGGREHTLAWKIAQSPLCKKLYIAPGNAGTKACGENVSLGITDFPTISRFCKENAIDLLVCGPEEPLVKGLRNYLEADAELQNLGIVGPGELGARLEGSKDFSKAFMLRNNIPTASAKTFLASEYQQALEYIQNHPLPIVLKADGLAAGKGVLICGSIDEAEDGLREMLLEGQFGAAGEKVVIEQFLDGIELSVFVLSDGSHYVVLPEAKDYKRIGDGDLGLNTGGMGSISPVPFAGKEFMSKVEERVIKPTILGLKKEGIPYKGFIFIGLMNVDGEPFVIEYNVRMGDPETQSVIPRIKNDLVELLQACAKGGLEKHHIEHEDFTAATVVLVAAGYPGPYAKGYPITGLDAEYPAIIFHAGTAEKNGKVVTNGGRVLGITGRGASISEAITQAYSSIAGIQWDGIYFRRDIGQDLLKL